SRLYVFDALVVATQDDDGRCAALAQRELDLRLSVQRVERRHDGADLPRAQLRNHELRAIWEQQRDAFASGDGQRCERRGAGMAQPLEFTVADGRSLVENRRVCRILR